MSIILLFFGCSEPKIISETDQLENVQIQPKKALELATPFIEEHATDQWKEGELKTYILKKGKWYYIMKSNYPAKSIYYYLKPAVMVNSKNGKIKFAKRAE